MLRRDLQAFLETGRARLVGHVVELQGRRRDGTEFPLEMALSVLARGGSVQFLAALRDLTERNRLRVALSQTEKLASVGRLSAGIAHEINNPLAFVSNNVTVLERDCKSLLAILDVYEQAHDQLAQVAPDKARQVQTLSEDSDLPYIRANLDRLLERTKDGLDRVTRIVHSLRGYARTGPAPRQDVFLPELFEASLEIIQGKIRKRGIRIQRAYGNPPKIRGNVTDINQVVLNLLLNACQAIEAMPSSHEGRIAIALQATGDGLLIDVVDNGCGIPLENQARLFDPFFTTKDVNEGTGLGLWISHNIVTAHGGRLEVDSQPGQGSRFRVFLPLQPPQDS